MPSGFLKKILGFLGLESDSSCEKGSCCSASSSPSKPDSSPAFKYDIFSPCDGVIVPQKEIPDEGFSEGYMGQGLGIKPSSPEVVAPCSGDLVVLFKTKHAYIIQDPKSKVSVMLHLGINTVNIPEEKNAFTTSRQKDEKLSAKDKLCKMDLDVIEKEATSTISALLVQNENMEGKKVIFHVNSGDVKKGDLLMSVVSA